MSFITITDPREYISQIKINIQKRAITVILTMVALRVKSYELYMV